MSKNNKNNPKNDCKKLDFESIFGNDGGKQL